MPAAVKIDEHTDVATSRHSARLHALSEEAAEIRQQHLAGNITGEVAAEKLEALKRRHWGFLERLIDL